MSIEENKALHRRFFEELFNQGNLENTYEIVSADYYNHNPAPGETPDAEGLKRFITTLRTAFPDLHFSVDDQLAEGDKVLSRWTATGTHQAEFAGVPATNRPIRVTALNIHRVVEGKIHEGWLNWDALGMMQQLGVIPTPEPAGA